MPSLNSMTLSWSNENNPLTISSWPNPSAVNDVVTCATGDALPTEDNPELLPLSVHVGPTLTNNVSMYAGSLTFGLATLGGGDAEAPVADRESNKSIRMVVPTDLRSEVVLVLQR